MAADWAEALAPVEDRVAAMGRFLREEIAAGQAYLPDGDHVFRAFRRPLADVRVLIVGQDPYPTPGHPIGLSFAVDPGVWPLPRSLVNIYRELRDDTGVVPPRSGDLTPWSEQGVMLLNRVLTVRPGESASHRGRGWEEVTEHAIRVLAARAEAGRPVRRDPVGTRRAEPQAAARGRPVGGVRAPLPALGQPRLLRLAALQPRQPAARRPGRRGRRLVARRAARGLVWPHAGGTARCGTARPGDSEPGRAGGRLRRDRPRHRRSHPELEPRRPAPEGLCAGRGPRPPLLDLLPRPGPGGRSPRAGCWPGRSERVGRTTPAGGYGATAPASGATSPSLRSTTTTAASPATPR